MADLSRSSDVSHPISPPSNTCPRCGGPVPFEEGFVSWCDRCNWNVQPEAIFKPRSRFEALYAELGRRFGQSLFKELSTSTDRPSSWSISRIAGWLLASSIHAITLFVLIAGIALVFSRAVSCLSLFGGLTLVGLAWVLRPRPIVLPDNAQIVSCQAVPRFYEFITQVASALKTKSIDGLVITSDFNAGLGLIGWQRKRILFIGLPLFTIAEPSARVALIAHELAHTVNGDPMRGLVVGGAFNTLVCWLNLLRPDPMLSQRYGLPGEFANVVVSVLAAMVWLLAHSLIHLLYRDTQRAEYLADRLAAQISGTSAMLAMLEKLHLHGVFQTSLRRTALSPVPLDFFVEFHERIRRLPAREYERIRRAERLEGSRLDLTHPPTVFRLEALAAYPVTTGQIVLSVTDSAAIDQELAVFQPQINRELKRQYEASLYK